MKKIDIIIAILAGEGVALLFSGLLKGSAISDKLPIWVLPIIFPILSLAGLWICYIIGKKFAFVLQIGKFFLIGVLATLVDLIIFKSLKWVFALDTELTRNIFKGASFLITTFIKYWGNKFWAFEKSEKAGMGKEISQFYLVTLIGLAINVGIFSLIANTIKPLAGISMQNWETVGVIIAALTVAAWNFLGYKFIVFKK